MNVKKILSLLTIALFISVLVSSCASREKCPGVGSVDQTTTQHIG